jgi:hypothetical protein
MNCSQSGTIYYVQSNKASTIWLTHDSYKKNQTSINFIMVLFVSMWKLQKQMLIIRAIIAKT